MRSINFNSKLYVNPVKDYKEHKDILLKLIDDMPPVMAGHVSRSDWLIQKQIDRPYLDYFYKNISKLVMFTLREKFKAVNYNITNGWYQQYRKGAYHQYHNHVRANFTNIFYLELPDSNYKTIIKDDDGKLISFQVKEGDLITFPAYLLHKSKPNGVKRKTIISFNSNFLY